MFNLLPKESKKIIIKDYHVRRRSVILTFIIFVQISLIIFLLPILTFSYFKEKELTAETKILGDSSAYKDADAVAKVINSTNTNLALFESTLSNPQIIPFIDKVISYKTNSLTFTDFIYEYKQDEDMTLLTVRGMASTRDSLVSFVRNLEESGVWSEVDLPVSNLARDRNIDFMISLYFKK